jgi:hypothetical protein
MFQVEIPEEEIREQSQASKTYCPCLCGLQYLRTSEVLFLSRVNKNGEIVLRSVKSVQCVV